MGSITFQTTVSDEQVIRPPADVRLPLGALEVTIRPATNAMAATSVTLANESLRRCRVSLGRATGIDNDQDIAILTSALIRVSLGRATGIDNEGIDADLARAYGNGSVAASPNGKP